MHLLKVDGKCRKFNRITLDLLDWVLGQRTYSLGSWWISQCKNDSDSATPSSYNCCTRSTARSRRRVTWTLTPLNQAPSQRKFSKRGRQEKGLVADPMWYITRNGMHKPSPHGIFLGLSHYFVKFLSKVFKVNVIPVPIMALDIAGNAGGYRLLLLWRQVP